jgi:pimeloyl-ACP methyl ester carboxylesterase
MTARRRVGRIAAVGLLVAIVGGFGGFYFTRNPEHRVLDDAVRANAPGKFVRLSDGVTHYQFDGPDSGRTVVLAHGFSVPLYIWDSTAAALASAGYRVLRYDAYGRGLSDRPDVVYSDKLFERQLGELLDSLHVRGKVDMGGVSAGGYVTAVYAGRHPDRVRSLILVDPVAGESPPTMRPYDLPVIGPYLWQVNVMPTMADGQTSDFVNPARFPDWVARYHEQMELRGFGHALLSSRVFRRGMNTDTMYRRVAAAGLPVLLVWGVKDNTVPFARNALVRQAIPSAEFHPIEGAAHLPILERAAETDSVILRFLAARPPD